MEPATCRYLSLHRNKSQDSKIMFNVSCTCIQYHKWSQDYKVYQWKAFMIRSIRQGKISKVESNSSFIAAQTVVESNITITSVKHDLHKTLNIQGLNPELKSSGLKQVISIGHEPADQQNNSSVKRTCKLKLRVSQQRQMNLSKRLSNLYVQKLHIIEETKKGMKLSQRKHKPAVSLQHETHHSETTSSFDFLRAVVLATVVLASEDPHG